MIDLMNKSRKPGFHHKAKKKGENKNRGRSLKIALLWVKKHFFYQELCKQKSGKILAVPERKKNSFGVSNGSSVKPVNV